MEGNKADSAKEQAINVKEARESMERISLVKGKDLNDDGEGQSTLRLSLGARL